MRTDDVVISVENLSKRYLVGHASARRNGSDSLRDALVQHSRNFARKAIDMARGRPIIQGDQVDEFWALKDVSFQVNRGEVLGIIGRNGAGKSTLLKTLSRITEPTRGRIKIRGRVASLLEVGTGFHPELTGRENIFLNGAILGMTKNEIRAKFDEIVSFADIDKFLDTPVKRYSSGMYVRLAFAVAAHLEPDILIVDEVLAVGDAEFQRKCLGKMDDVGRSGRTVLFVSHNMGVVGSLCRHVLWFNEGRIREAGPPECVIPRYMAEAAGLGATGGGRFSEEPAKPFQLLEARTCDSTGADSATFGCDNPVVIDCRCVVRETVPGLYGYMSISRADGTVVMVSDSFDTGENPLECLSPGRRVLRITIPPRTLAAGDYSVFLNFTSHRSKVGFNVDSPGTVARFRLDDYTTRRGNERGGYLSTRLGWSLDPDESLVDPVPSLQAIR